MCVANRIRAAEYGVPTVPDFIFVTGTSHYGSQASGKVLFKYLRSEFSPFVAQSGSGGQWLLGVLLRTALLPGGIGDGARRSVMAFSQGSASCIVTALLVRRDGEFSIFGLKCNYSEFQAILVEKKKLQAT